MRATKVLLVWMLLAAALMAPIADVAAFGIHDHISVPDANSGDLTRDGSDSGRSHHCELWMSPGTVLVVQDLPPLAQFAALDAPPALPRGSLTLSVPVSPPRS